MAGIDVLLSGRVFLEGPRWRDDGLYVSDIHGDQVLHVGLDGTVEVLIDIVRPSGLGFLSDGRLIVNAMGERKVYRREHDGSVVEHADCSALAPLPINDMVTDSRGRAYISQFGYDKKGGAPVRRAPVLRADPDGTVEETDSALAYGNGLVMTPDDLTLIVAEHAGGCLTAFDVHDDGTLSGSRLWADLDDAAPDGICLDEEGAVWVACFGERFMRVLDGGQVTDEVKTPGRQAIACALGGDDGRTLFLITISEIGNRESMRAARLSTLEVTRVDVPGCQRP
jgi:sugar lactone lactonase YvrE